MRALRATLALTHGWGIDEAEQSHLAAEYDGRREEVRLLARLYR
jgi:hypothetical protein